MTISILQAVQLQGSNPITGPITGITAGSTIVVFSINVQVLVDDQNGTYPILTSTTSTDTYVENIHVLVGSAAGTLNLTGSLYAGSPSGGLIVLEIGGARTTSYTPASVATHTSPGTGTDAQTTGNITPTAAPALFIGCGIDVSTYAAAPAVGTGFTNYGTFLNNGSGDGSRVEYLRVTATTPRPVLFTATNGGGDSVSMGVVIEEAILFTPSLFCILA